MDKAQMLRALLCNNITVVTTSVWDLRIEGINKPQTAAGLLGEVCICKEDSQGEEDST